MHIHVTAVSRIAGGIKRFWLGAYSLYIGNERSEGYRVGFTSHAAYIARILTQSKNYYISDNSCLLDCDTDQSVIVT